MLAIDAATNRMCIVAQFTSSPRFRSFWPFQLGGWLLYGTALAASMVPLRNMREDVAYHSMFLLSGFVASFLMYGVCHALWCARAPLYRALVICTIVAYGLGILCSAASQWSEIRFGGGKWPFHWSYTFAGATGSCFVLVAWSALYFGIKHYHALEEQRQRLQTLEAMARQAQMRALRYQLQPHFLFNTLNAISTLVLDNQPRIATQMIARLADLLRRTLESPDTHQVSLKEEIAVTKEYLALEKVRFGSRLSVTFEIDPETQEAQVPRFLLQPLVENAIRHGIAKRPDGGNIILHSELVGGRLRVRIENDEAEDDEPVLRRNTATPHRGVGLTNTRARLQQMYGHEATLETHATTRGTYEVRISMPFSIAEVAVPDLQTLEAQ
jgi:two-component system sensor histidine kinase AlgZ